MNTRLFLLATLCVATLGALVAAAPAVALGRSTLELPPRPGNPRNSEGAFADLRDGRILFVYSHFLGSSGEETWFDMREAGSESQPPCESEGSLPIRRRTGWSQSTVGRATGGLNLRLFCVFRGQWLA